jgi:hypothetical protein
VTQTPAARPIDASNAPTRVRRAALLAAAGALGLLAGFGVGEGTPLIVLGTAGLRLRGLPEFVTPDRGVGVMTLLGAVHSALVAYGWGLLSAAVARRLQGWGAVAALAVVAVALTLVDQLLPTFLRLGAGAPSIGERVLCALVVVAAAALGTRLAAPARRTVASARAVERRRDARYAVIADADVTDVRDMAPQHDVRSPDARSPDVPPPSLDRAPDVGGDVRPVRGERPIE